MKAATSLTGESGEKFFESSTEEVDPIGELGLCNGSQGDRGFDGRHIQATLDQWLGRNTRSSTDFDHLVTWVQPDRLNKVIKDIVGIPRSMAVVVESLGSESL